MMRAIDLFAGPGGWDVGAGPLGIEPVGVEYDDAACATREAAGLKTIQADVAALDPVGFAGDEGCDLLIASPPCQAWSMAGKRQGQDDLPLVFDYTRTMHTGGVHPPEWYRERCADDRSLLVCEPLRWALALRPTYLAFEQVPPVLDYWRRVGTILGAEGWDVWTGILEAERYGVPQTRERAILMARRGGHVHPPIATHQRYVPGEPARHVVTLEGEVLPWVSMAEALGWGMTERPMLTVAAGTESGGADSSMVGGSGARKRMSDERDRGAWKVGFPRKADGGEATDDGYRARDFRDDSELGDRVQPGGGNKPRPASEPSATLGTRTDLAEWTEGRPATTVTGDPRVHPPGHKRNAEDEAAGRTDYEGRAGENAVRVTVAEASVLQSFPADYPWQGSRTKQFQQIGNAVPPVLAHAILAALTEGT